MRVFCGGLHGRYEQAYGTGLVTQERSIQESSWRPTNLRIALLAFKILVWAYESFLDNNQ
jgi:hypothetical protein